MTNVSVYNIVGQKVIDCDVCNADEISLDVDILNDGVYMLKISSSRGEMMQKINVRK